MRTMAIRLFGVAGAVAIAIMLTFASPTADRVGAQIACSSDGAAAHLSRQ